MLRALVWHFKRLASQFLRTIRPRRWVRAVWWGGSCHRALKLNSFSTLLASLLLPPLLCVLWCVCTCVCVCVVFISTCSYGAQPTKIKTHLTGLCWSLVTEYSFSAGIKTRLGKKAVFRLQEPTWTVEEQNISRCKQFENIANACENKHALMGEACKCFEREVGVDFVKSVKNSLSKKGQGGMLNIHPICGRGVSETCGKRESRICVPRGQSHTPWDIRQYLSPFL